MAGLYFELVFLFKIYLWMYFRWIACLCLHFIDLIREGYSTRLNWAETIKVGPRGQWWGPWCWWWGEGGWGWRRQWWFGRRWWWWQRYSTQLGRNYQGRSSAFHPAPNQTHCSPNANVLLGANTDTDGHADMYQYSGMVGQQAFPNQTKPNQTHCSPNVLFGTNTDADGHADMYQYTGKVGFSNIFIGPRFSSNQLVRRSVCRSRHHQQHYNTVEANRAMQFNASGL